MEGQEKIQPRFTILFNSVFEITPAAMIMAKYAAADKPINPNTIIALTNNPPDNNSAPTYCRAKYSIPPITALAMTIIITRYSVVL